MMEQTSVEEGQAGAGRGDRCCRLDCGAGERYLTTSSPRFSASPQQRRHDDDQGQEEQRPKEEEEEEEEEENELVHVMVTRPEIASKPRDNILFEGDMDLRTTFETSYEALARMRLEQWRKYQEAVGASKPPPATTGKTRRQAGAAAAAPALETSSQRLVRRSAKAPASEQIGALPAKLDGRAADIKGVSTAAASNNTTIYLDQQYRKQKQPLDGSRGGASPAPAPSSRSRTPFAAADTNSQNVTTNYDATDWDYHYNLNRSSRRPQLANSSSPAGGGQAASISETTAKKQTIGQVEAAQQQQQLVDSSTPTVQPVEEVQKGRDASYVDPDLAPIIVYDANMNRLERVGIRKRSKYRPSTSLRSGARGLFGDQEPLPPDEGRSGSRNEDKAAQTEESLEGRIRRPSIGQKPISNGSRNEISTVQPVHSKRRVANNFNTRRDEDIVEVGNEPSWSRRTPVADHGTGATAGSASKGFFATQPPDDKERGEFALERDLAEIRLAEEEEIAANAEIQRVAALYPGGEPKSSTHLMNHQNQLPFNAKAANGVGADSGGETRTNSRQSRMQRTCQDQSFHIGQNDYPPEAVMVAAPPTRVSHTFEAKSKPASAMDSTRASPQSRVYNNLFSESPDFILTTGKPVSVTPINSDGQTRRQSSIEDKKQRYASGASALVTGANPSDRLIESRIDQTHPDALTTTAELNATNQSGQYQQFHPTIGGKIHYSLAVGGECRVTKLEERFQYVGSKSGHKYFVEKFRDIE